MFEIEGRQLIKIFDYIESSLTFTTRLAVLDGNKVILQVILFILSIVSRWLEAIDKRWFVYIMSLPKLK